MSKKEKPNFEAYPDLPRQINKTQQTFQLLPRGARNALAECGTDITGLPPVILEYLESHDCAKKSGRYGWVLTQRGKQLQQRLKDMRRGRN